MIAPDEGTRIMPATIRILSAGAPKLGVGRCASAFAHKTGLEVATEFATAPAIRDRIERGAAEADVLVAPVPHIRNYADGGRIIAGTETPVGAVRAGVAVRGGTPPPDLSSVGSLKKALLEADAILYNTASSGQYIEELMERLGLAEALASKTERFPTGTAVMVRLAEGTAGREIGFGQVTEIRRFETGVTLVGPLPDEIGKTTHYVAGLLASTATHDSARALLDFMGSPAATRIYAESGLE